MMVNRYLLNVPASIFVPVQKCQVHKVKQQVHKLISCFINRLT